MIKTFYATTILAILITGLIILPGTSKVLAYSSFPLPVQHKSISLPAEEKFNALPFYSSSSHTKPIDLNFVMAPSFNLINQAMAQKLIEKGAKMKNITFVALEKEVKLPQVKENVHAMTFNGTIPSPTVRITQGDILNITMINHPDNKLIHSIDHHASIISAVPNFGPVYINKSISYSFVATQPGFFKYHCEGNGVLGMDQHVFSGMAGGVIVDPINGYKGYSYPTYDDNGNAINQTVSPDAKEIQYLFSEWYLDNAGNYDQQAMFSHQPTYTSINGIPFGYDPVITKTENAKPIHIKQGDHVRFFLMNLGDAMVNFHIVGEQLDRIVDGQVISGLGKQTYLIGGSNDAIADVVFDKPGVFAPVNHDYASLFKGQASLIVVDGPDGQPGKSLGLDDYKNPSNAVPPIGKNRITIETTPYYLGEPIVWNGNQDSPIKSSLTGENISGEVGKETQNPLPGSNKTAAGGGAPPANITTSEGEAPVIPK